MDAALGWIGAIVEWFGQFLPRWRVVPTTDGWVKWVHGDRIQSGGAGVVFWWPAVTVFQQHPVARQAIDLRGQTITTKDEKVVMAGGLITYRINDIEKALTTVYAPDETIRDTALSAVHTVLASRTWAEVQEGERSGELERALRKEARRILEPYGVRVLKLNLTDLSPTRVIKLSMTSDQV